MSINKLYIKHVFIYEIAGQTLSNCFKMKHIFKGYTVNLNLKGELVTEVFIAVGLYIQ